VLNPDFDENLVGGHQADFDELVNRTSTLATPFPSSLQSPAGNRVVTCLDDSLTPTTPLGINPDGTCPDGPDAGTDPENIKRVVVDMTWWSRDRMITVTSSPYYISRVGICSDGT
jgi:hypothetical protein